MNNSLKPARQIKTRQDDISFVSTKTLNRLLFQDEWKTITIPDINQAAMYANVTVKKIKNDLLRHDCPLRIYKKGNKGRGNTALFFKQSVEIYKEWLTNKRYIIH